ncbi:MAG: aminotransferase class V-fold PLP-dependent enzyme [candidate division KSB1 bacterium]|nr:aminotransferase class V-fold PLP-dependent enzyme [candidate division KSB1 bacterium]MDZ7342116.1 aminotransferase class V-fold PLP-dependent enzyme [candidate division KSB1 bacterium]
MDQNSYSEQRRRFLKQFLGGVACTAILPRTLDAQVHAFSNNNFVQIIEELKSAQDNHDERFWHFVGQQYALAPDLIYMNTGGLGPSPYPVIETVANYTMKLEQTSETGHEFVAKVRQKACHFFNCGADEIAFTRNATEGMNIIARGLALKKGDEVLMTTHEHPGGAMPWLALANDVGIRVRLFEPGQTAAENLQRIESNLSSRTKVLAISHITCTTGLKFPATEIAEICRRKNIIFVLDGAQVIGMQPVDFRQLGCDFYTASGHKWLGGPKGTGILFIRQEMLNRWRPTHVGAYSDRIYKLEEQILEHQPSAAAVEYGTRNTPLILGLGVAFDFLAAIGMDVVAARGQALARYFMERLQPLQAIRILTPLDSTSYGSIVTFQLNDGRARNHGELASAIHANANIRLRPVAEHGLNAIRASFHLFNNHEQVDRLIEVLHRMLTSD